jgi:hypothetical protein
MSGDLIRRTKIVATLGPAWQSEEQMHAMFDAGVNIVRINASHGTPEIRSEWIRRIQKVREERGHAIGILVDLHGPRIRVGKLPEAITLTPGQLVTFVPEGTEQGEEIPTTYPELAGDVTVGSFILLDDGLLSVEVVGVHGDRVEGRVRYGGLLKPNKGMNLPGADVSAPAMTEEDREEVLRATALGVAFIGVSFVRRAEDLHAVRRIIPKTTRLVAKIEKDTALQNLDEILDATDAVMVARGDLGVELPFEQVPLVQKRLIQAANRRGKPVITATQMLESMITNPRPTRAEASDVANAILDGTDAVMLSGETAIGEYPIESGPGDGSDRARGRVGATARHRQGPSSLAGAARPREPLRGHGGADGRGDRGRREHRRRHARRARDRLLHLERLHGPDGLELPAAGADLRLHPGAGDVPATGALVGRGAGDDPAHQELRSDDGDRTHRTHGARHRWGR